MQRLKGHKVEAKALREGVRTARELGFEAVTIYARELGRATAALAGLVALRHQYLVAEREELMTNQIPFFAIGDLARVFDSGARATALCRHACKVRKACCCRLWPLGS